MLISLIASGLGLTALTACDTTDVKQTKITVTVADNPKLKEICGVDDITLSMTIEEYAQAVKTGEWKKWCPGYGEIQNR